MICFRILYLTSLLLFGINISLWGYEKRELLQKEVTLDELKSTLVTEQKWVIYPPYSDRKQWNALLGDYKDHLIRQGEQFLKYNWQVIKASDFLAYERIGSRNRMQGPHNKNNMALSALILAELAEGKGRFLEQIVDGIFFNCEKTTWAVSAHLTAMQKSGRALPELDDPIIDLSSGEIAALMSWAHYFFQKEFDAISPQINVRLEREIHRQIFKPYMNVSRFRWQAINYKPGLLVNNWTPWCNFNVLQCYLLWENDRNKLAEAIYRTICSVDQFINYAHSDGACEEGPGYWGHAAGKPVDTLGYANRIGQVPLAFQPGDRWMYGSSADILGAVIETVSGKKFGDFLREELFEPLGMVDTDFWVPEEKLCRFAENYEEKDGKLVPCLWQHLGLTYLCRKPPEFQSGGAGLCSTMDDYAAFAEMLLNEGVYNGRRILSKNAVRYMTSNQLTQYQLRTCDWEQCIGYGYGNLMRVAMEERLPGISTHPGEYGWDGWLGCFWANDPKNGYTFMYFVQRCGGLGVRPLRMIKQIVYGAED